MMKHARMGLMHEHTNQAMHCPSCQATGLQGFYKTAPVPVHSCLMLEDEASAREFPRREIALAYCPACGFVTNTVFDPNLQDYSARYEDQQSFSKRFQAFQTELISGLIERYDIRNKRVLEIGCGKGDFLVELCRTGNNRGVGIDPRSNPQAGDAAAGIRFVPEYYSRKHRDIPCDLVVCRHTLEHLHDTGRFIGEVRQALESASDALVFFEVPDARRVFRDCAFWDIYYEHCSYFTAESLADVFVRNRYEVLDLQHVFAGSTLR